MTLYMKTYLSFLLLFAAQLLTGCMEEEEDYGHVTVKGRVYDSNRQQPVANQLVYVFDHGGVSMPWMYQNILDSTRTDASGHYELGFERKNLNQTYVTCGWLSFSDKPTYAYAKDHPGETEVKGSNGTYDFDLHKISVLRVRLKVINNPYPPLKVWATANVGFSPSPVVWVHGNHNDTVFYLRGVANEMNAFGLEAKSPDGSYNRSKWDYHQLGAYADTLEVTMVADPSTFPGKG
ncbi:hypothetical protein [Rufibacter hautae]|uniref:Carboxypeptidase regulatory-like domain-containing protein n=1 Tax=Rufibacter hautae TaxID=2595005 RepID=A0A5B6THG9_9BACT|nr:hypothetical protein [Rufibacter hautae]KAA3438765.1 hypothetical protein FOA19_16245 [Rufibacter hautae]